MEGIGLRRPKLYIKSCRAIIIIIIIIIIIRRSQLKL